MAKNLTHQQWIEEQFKPKYLNVTYRNVLLHASIIEAMVTKHSGMRNFDPGNKFLLCAGYITKDEFCVFDSIRNERNKLVHNIFSKKGGLTQNQILEIMQNLMEVIHKAYKSSKFLDENLFNKYKLTRCSSITSDRNS